MGSTTSTLYDIHKSTIHGDLDKVKQYIQQDPSCLQRKFTFRGETPLHLATTFDHVDIVKYMIEINPQCLWYKDACGKTPVHYTAKKQHDLQIIRHIMMLLSLSSSSSLFLELLSNQDNNGNSLLHLAMYNNNVPLVEFILQEYPTMFNAQQLLLCNIKNNNGETPLDLAKRFPSNKKGNGKYFTKSIIIS